MARRVVQASNVAALCSAIPNPIHMCVLWRSSASNCLTETVIGVPGRRNAFTEGPVIGSGSGAFKALDTTVPSEVGEGSIDISEESGVRGRETSMADAESASEEELTGCRAAIFSAEKTICEGSCG